MAIRAGKYHPIIQRGASWRPVITWYTKNLDTGVMTPVNLDGCSVRAQFRKKPGDTALFDLSTANGKITVAALGSPAVSKIYPVITDEETAALSAVIESGVWALEVTHPDGSVTRLLEGNFKASAEIVA